MRRFIIIIVLAICLLLSPFGVMAYEALTSTGTVTVGEPLYWVEEPNLTVQLYPQQGTVIEMKIGNLSVNSIAATVTVTVTPEIPGLSIGYPSTLTVPGKGQATLTISLGVAQDGEPGECQLSVVIQR